MRLAILKVKRGERLDDANYQLAVVPCEVVIHRKTRNYEANCEIRRIDEVVVFAHGISYVLDMTFEEAVCEVDRALDSLPRQKCV